MREQDSKLASFTSLATHVAADIPIGIEIARGDYKIAAMFAVVSLGLAGKSLWRNRMRNIAIEAAEQTRELPPIEIPARDKPTQSALNYIRSNILIKSAAS